MLEEVGVFAGYVGLLEVPFTYQEEYCNNWYIVAWHSHTGGYGSHR